MGASCWPTTYFAVPRGRRAARNIMFYESARFSREGRPTRRRSRRPAMPGRERESSLRRCSPTTTPHEQRTAAALLAGRSRPRGAELDLLTAVRHPPLTRSCVPLMQGRQPPEHLVRRASPTAVSRSSTHTSRLTTRVQQHPRPTPTPHVGCDASAPRKVSFGQMAGARGTCLPAAWCRRPRDEPPAGREAAVAGAPPRKQLLLVALPDRRSEPRLPAGACEPASARARRSACPLRARSERSTAHVVSYPAGRRSALPCTICM